MLRRRFAALTLFAATLTVLCVCAESTEGAGPQLRSPAATESLDDWMHGLLGWWVGAADPTPVGRIEPFGMRFVPSDDGSFHARAERGPDDYLDFRFHRDAGGRWLFTEEGALPGVGVQAHTLELIDVDGATTTWAVPGRADFLRVEIARAGDTLSMIVWLRDELHFGMELARPGSRMRGS